jgi:hypothetical protein
MKNYYMHADEAELRKYGYSEKSIRALKADAARGRAAHRRDLKYPLTVHVRDDFTPQQKEQLRRNLGPELEARVVKMFQHGDYAGTEAILRRHKHLLHHRTR